MPRQGNYAQCKIYKIFSLSQPDLVYYGHTCQTLAQRKSSHNSKRDCTSRIIFEIGDAVIILVEAYPCENEDQARAKEAEYIINNQCINKNIPGRTKAKYYVDNKETILDSRKIFYIANKESVIESVKEYYVDNKETILESRKEYYLKNKEAILQYKRKRYQEKKANLN
jgi:GIY-YIG catalytic domain